MRNVFRAAPDGLRFSVTKNIRGRDFEAVRQQETTLVP